MKAKAKSGKTAFRLAVASGAFMLALSSVAYAQLVPRDLFTARISQSAPLGVEANGLTFNADTNTITASGDVVLKQDGYTLTGQSLTYKRASNEVSFAGAVIIVDPSGNVLEAQDFQLTGGMKLAFIQALTIRTYDGARITADSADYDEALRTILQNATYTPCGECIDAQGRRIGWSVSAQRVTYNAVDGSLQLEQPSLALLGVPVAWLPYLWLPDTSDNALANLPTPNIDSSDQIGIKAEIPFTAYSNRWTDIILTPTLLTRQSFLMGVEWRQRFDAGSFRIKASGLYQLDQSAFTFADAKRDWRGALQTSGSFRPVTDWTVGWSYTAFTDPAYLTDYRMTRSESSVNEVYATHLTSDTFFDLRVQQFNRLGNHGPVAQGQQARAVPTVRFEHIEDLGPGLGRLEISGRLLGVQRDYGSRLSRNGVPYVLGYEGNKQHASLQAGWQTQWIGAAGFVATPYLGGRADFAYYDGTSPIGPGETTLWSATPIAAMDVRFPMAANDGSTVHLIEPIVQLAYRGSDVTAVGITNDDSQSFVFDDTNLFSYNRFSGNDRQETGLRANVGGRYQANFADGGYFEVVAGQSFLLAGENAFAAADPAQTGVGAGLDATASYAVLGAYGSFVPGFKAGGKLQVDTSDFSVARAGLGASYSNDGYSADFSYTYLPANTDGGILKDQHEIGGEIGVPVADYWTVKASTYWDLASNTWLQVGGGVVYDDGYLVMGGHVTRNGPTHDKPDDTRFTATFRVKAPAGLDVGYNGRVAR
ncbi:LPS assembly protein LptD [Devosia sp. 2618]|uniref:LPS-assembly protein LptD n=1 Tax=Devosia sp. 2618 TaxID=3156454 RepID=UPI00339A7814